MNNEPEDETTRSYNEILSIKDNRIRRKELNKLAQRNSRKRKGENLTRLQSENAELKRKLAATRKEKEENNETQSFSSTSKTPNSADTPFQNLPLPTFDGNNNTHFGWFSFGDLQQKLSDTSKEAPFHTILGQHFPLQLQQSQPIQPSQQEEIESERPQDHPNNQDTLWMTTLGGPGIAHTASLMAM